MKIQWIKSCFFVLSFILITGCTMKAGGLNPNTQFVYPNSNVKILGPVEADISKWTVLGIGAFFEPDEIRAVYDEALSQQEGANVIVNFDESSVTTSYVFMVKSSYTISGQAASMDVGQQKLN